MIPIYIPYLPKHVLQYAHDAIDSTWISGSGKYIDLVRDELRDITKSKYVILTSNGTTATHLVAKSLEYKYPIIKELIVPSNVYVAAWNTFKMNPIYDFDIIDSDIDTWNLDTSKLNKNDKNKAVLVVHNVGNIMNVPKLKRDLPNHIFIEDNCEGFFGKYENIMSGVESLASSVSFFGNKTITSGEGGAFFTNDDDVYKYINSVKSQGITNEKFIFDKLGYNYRMTNIQAGVLYGQLKFKNEILENKNRIFDLYKKLLIHENIIFQQPEESTIPANWMFSIRIKSYNIKQLKELELFLYQNGIETRPMFPDINKHKHLKTDKEFTISKLLYEQVIMLPSYPTLTNTQVKFVCEKIISYLEIKK